jgi:hypothetical protein
MKHTLSDAPKSDNFFKGDGLHAVTREFRNRWVAKVFFIFSGWDVVGGKMGQKTFQTNK